jgi:hypothetical protein
MVGVRDQKKETFVYDEFLQRKETMQTKVNFCVVLFVTTVRSILPSIP